MTRRPRGERLRLALVGSGWIASAHLDALDRLGRSTLIGVVSPREESARAVAEPRGAPAFTSVERVLDERPDVVYVCVPPSAAVAVLDRIVERGIPFLTEKPLAATDADGPAGRDPYEAQAEAFLDAVAAGDPARVLATYADALRTDRLTRAVVAATGRPG